VRALPIVALAALCVTHTIANPYFDPDEIGMTMLTIWPTARSTALAGAMTALADEADAAYFNPAGLAFQTTAKADLSYGNWLPGLYPGMYYVFAAGGAPLRLSFLDGRNAYVSGSLTRMSVGETDVVDERGNYLGRHEAWRGAAAVCAAASLGRNSSAGVSLKVLRSEHLMYLWGWDLDGIAGLEAGGNATAIAADVGLAYRPDPRFSLGLDVTNLGPKLRYSTEYGDTYSAALPSMARLGMCWTPVESRNVRVRVMPEVDKSLVRIFRDSTGTTPFGRKLEKEWKAATKAVGVEATAFSLVSLRLGYFEDLIEQRGGIVLEKDGQTYHYGLWDALSRKGLGRLKSIGLCWGFGVGNDVLRFDVSNDAAIYDFPTQNWKLQLTCNDIGKLLGVRS